MPNPVIYDESKIRHLEDTDHIRTRPGMYIGRLGDGSHAEDGIYVLLKESIDNSIDEFNEGFGKRIEVNVEESKSASIRDYGRGIPLGSLVDAVSKLNTGAKYDTSVFTASVGLNGVGLKAVNASRCNSLSIQNIKTDKNTELWKTTSCKSSRHAARAATIATSR